MKIIVMITGLLAFATGLYSQSFEEGEINGARYTIIMPDDWNGGLVMYAHGYEETDEFVMEEEEEFEEEEEEIAEEEEEEFFEIFTRRGFAFAASDYRRKGLVIKEGMEDTEALRAFFEAKYGKPSMTLITGHSMGGMITIATIERYPSEYQGAMPLCGWLAPVHQLFKTVLDMLVTYDYLFGPNDGQIVNGEEMVSPESINERLQNNTAMLELFAEHFRIKQEDLPMVIFFAQTVMKESTGWMGGLPVGNLETIYDGFGFRDDGINKHLKRYAADPAAREFVLHYNTPTGKISDPVLALHNSYDELLPASNYDYYQSATAKQQTDHLYRQKYVVRDGHCAFENEEVAASFDQLVRWIQEGERPELNYR